MIPEFPKFKKLELSDKKDVEKFTSKFPPYSDFNFISMWSWDIKGDMRISQLHGNLVVRFADYITNKPFMSFIGRNKINETASTLIAFSKRKYKIDFLKFIPEEIANDLNQAEFTVTLNADSQDYIYDVEHLVNMNNWTGHPSSKGILKFLQLHSDYMVKISSIRDIKKDEYIELFKKWAKNKNINNHFELNEYKAFDRLLNIIDDSIKAISIYKNDILLGFTVYEIVSKDYAVASFSKADVRHHSAIYDILNWEEAKTLQADGVKYYNWEQDLGILGLRRLKMKYKPIHFLKKFIVTKAI